MRTYGIKQVDFYDENMTLDKKRMADICDLIVERGLHMSGLPLTALGQIRWMKLY